MNYVEMQDRSLSLLRLLTNSYIGKEAAELLLEGEELASVLDLQAVMILGMDAEEKGEEVSADPKITYDRIRRRMPTIGNHYDEVQYLLQPGYQQHLKTGMEVLALL